jgi:hypothetical protein
VSARGAALLHLRLCAGVTDGRTAFIIRGERSAGQGETGAALRLKLPRADDECHALVYAYRETALNHPVRRSLTQR